MYPIITKIGPFTLHTFGVMLAIGILVGSTMLVREAKRLGDPRITEERLQSLIWWVVLGVILGGRLMHTIVEWRYFSKHPTKILAIWEGGLVMYGGFIGTFIAVTTFAVRNNIKILRLCDLIAPSAFLGLAIGRWGCFFAGDDYGKPAPGLAWAVTFTDPNSLVPRHLKGIPLHPTQIYMSLKALTIFGILLWITRRKKFDGQVAGAAFMLYAVLRSVVELYRGDLDRGSIGPLSTAQFTSIFGFALGVLILWMAPRRTLADDLADAERRALASEAQRSKRKAQTSNA